MMEIEYQFLTCYLQRQCVYVLIVCLYFSNFQTIPMPYQSRQEKDVEWLWKVSEKWTRLNENTF